MANASPVPRLSRRGERVRWFVVRDRFLYNHKEFVTESKAPAKFRVVRPYATEDDYIRGDFAWIGRTWIILPNIPARDAGELVRFEVVLTSGAPVIRGEGNVIGYNPPGGPRPAGLEVKLSRFDARSKAILDRVHAHRLAITRTGERSLAPRVPGGPSDRGPTGASRAPMVVSMPPLGASIPPVNRGMSSAPREGPKRAIVAPPNREEMLERLRERAKALASRGGFDYKRAKEMR
jgi:hypothetical protein